MRWIHQSSLRFYYLSSLSVSVSVSSSPPLALQSKSHQPSSGNKIKMSPGVVVIIVIVGLILLISGLIHLVVRFVIKKRSNPPQSVQAGTGATQRQLQQLFKLHDSGVDQAFIDALPVFLYKEITMGLMKEGFDCAVCLCEFAQQDKLRLVPMCSHAFHIHCIDTWLLSNSTCPLCRGSVFSPPAFSFENPFYDFDDSISRSRELDAGKLNLTRAEEEGNVGNSSRVFSVRLGKFKTTPPHSNEQGESSNENMNENMNARRCFSMGSCQYVVDDSEELQVELCSTSTSMIILKERLGQNGNSSSSMVMVGVGDTEVGKRIIGSKGESFSVSKIWLWSKKGKGKFQTCSASTTTTTSTSSNTLNVMVNNSSSYLNQSLATVETLRLNSTQPTLCPNYLHLPT